MSHPQFSGLPLSTALAYKCMLMEGLYQNQNDISLARWIKMEQMTGLWPRLYRKFCPPFSHSSRSQSFSHVRCKSLWLDVSYNQSLTWWRFSNKTHFPTQSPISNKEILKMLIACSLWSKLEQAYCTHMHMHQLTHS